MYGIITVIVSALIAVIGIWKGYRAKEEERTIFGLSRIGALLVVLAIVGGVAGILSTINDYKVKINPITVSPTKFSAYGGVFDNRTIIEVHNRSDETIYTAWVKILTEKPSFEAFGTILITDDGRRFVKLEGGELFNPEVLMIPALDKDGQPVTFLIFRSLSPKETWRFRFNFQSVLNVPRNKKMTFRFSVIDYKREPYPYGVKGDAAFFKFQIPEGFSFVPGGPFFLMLEKKRAVK